MERAALGLSPRASHPAGQEPDDARRGGDRPSSTDLELHAQLTSVDLQSGSSLVACDLVSHVANAITRSAAGQEQEQSCEKPADAPDSALASSLWPRWLLVTYDRRGRQRDVIQKPAAFGHGDANAAVADCLANARGVRC